MDIPLPSRQSKDAPTRRRVYKSDMSEDSLQSSREELEMFKKDNLMSPTTVTTFDQILRSLDSLDLPHSKEHPYLREVIRQQEETAKVALAKDARRKEMADEQDAKMKKIQDEMMVLSMKLRYGDYFKWNLAHLKDCEKKGARSKDGIMGDHTVLFGDATWRVIIKNIEAERLEKTGTPVRTYNRHLEFAATLAGMDKEEAFREMKAYQVRNDAAHSKVNDLLAEKEYEEIGKLIVEDTALLEQWTPAKYSENDELKTTIDRALTFFKSRYFKLLEGTYDSVTEEATVSAFLLQDKYKIREMEADLKDTKEQLLKEGGSIAHKMTLVKGRVRQAELDSGKSRELLSRMLDLHLVSTIEDQEYREHDREWREHEELARKHADLARKHQHERDRIDELVLQLIAELDMTITMFLEKRRKCENCGNNHRDLCPKACSTCGSSKHLSTNCGYSQLRCNCTKYPEHLKTECVLDSCKAPSCSNSETHIAVRCKVQCAVCGRPEHSPNGCKTAKISSITCILCKGKAQDHLTTHCPEFSKMKRCPANRCDVFQCQVHCSKCGFRGSQCHCTPTPPTQSTPLAALPSTLLRVGPRTRPHLPPFRDLATFFRSQSRSREPESCASFWA